MHLGGGMMYQGYQNNNYYQMAFGALAFSGGFVNTLQKAGPVSVTLGLSNNGGASQATAILTKAPYYAEWEAAFIYNSKNFEGWGAAFKYVTDKVMATKGSIHFELSGLNIGEALSGNPSIFVGRYTSYELQQIIANPKLFSNTTFYMNVVEQTAEQLAKLGIKR
jgi:hypothetical protein